VPAASSTSNRNRAFSRGDGRRHRRRRSARFIEREFRDFLGCGALGWGFARVRCDACRFERLVPFFEECKKRGIEAKRIVVLEPGESWHCYK